MHDYGYKPEEAIEALTGRPTTRFDLPVRFFPHLSAYRSWREMWELHEEIKRESQAKKMDKPRLKKLHDRFREHPVHELYAKHIRSPEGQKALRDLLQETR